MELYQGAFIIIAVLGILMLILAVKTNSVLILNFVLRSIAGTLVIFGVNQILEFYDFSIGVGVNPVTVLTSGILGFPGVILLFGIKIYSGLWKSDKIYVFLKMLWTNKKMRYILTITNKKILRLFKQFILEISKNDSWVKS